MTLDYPLHNPGIVAALDRLGRNIYSLANDRLPSDEQREITDEKAQMMALVYMATCTLAAMPPTMAVAALDSATQTVERESKAA